MGIWEVLSLKKALTIEEKKKESFDPAKIMIQAILFKSAKVLALFNEMSYFPRIKQN